MIIRIYTEDKNREKIHEICQAHLAGYTLIPCEGVWKGVKENSLIIEVIEGFVARDACLTVARAIKQANQQEAVLLVQVNGCPHRLL